MRNLVVLVLLLTLVAMPALAQDDPPPADIVNDEGGVALVTGSFTISSQNIIDSVYQPLVILEDQAGFVDRNLDYVLPIESQVIAAFTSPFQVGKITYMLSLPAQPQGGFRDVDNNGEDGTGVQIFQIAWWDNRYGTVYLEERDGHGWSTAWGTVSASIHPETLYEYTGGSLIIWSPDGQQGFPAGFGEDGLLFTADDPIVIIPAGYTVVNMDTDPFTFDRSREVVLDLVEPEDVVPYDFSGMGYSDAFNALVDVAVSEYAFTEFKGIDWEALRAEFLPRFEDADAKRDNAAYLFALRDFAWSIPDGHVGIYGATTPLDNEFVTNTDGGLGIAVLELDDGRFVVSFVLSGGPADQAGIKLLAELIEINGVPVADALRDVRPYSSPFSTAEFERVQQLRYLLVGPVGTEMKLVYKNPGDTRPTAVTLTTIAERQGFGFSSIMRGRSGLEPPIWYKFLPEGIGYIEITDFSQYEPLLITTWEAFLRTAIDNGIEAIILDLRYNGGGFSSFGTRMASYFFTEEMPVRFGEGYNREIDAFFYDDRYPVEIEPPIDESLIYDGQIIVLVGQACASACELFAYDLGLSENVTFIGQYASQGIAGGWPLLYMPDDIIFALPATRYIDMEGNIILEGMGIQPDVHVPIDENTVLRAGEDIVLGAAIDYIFGEQEAAVAGITTVDGGRLTLGESVTGELAADAQRVRYFLPAVNVAMSIDFLSESEIEAYLRLYVVANDALAFESPFPVRQIDIPAGLDLYVEVGSQNDNLTGEFTLLVRESVPVEWSAEDAGAIAIGETVSGELAEGVRFRYTLEVTEDMVLDIHLGDEAGELDTYLRVYVDDLEEPAFENDDIVSGVERNSELLGLEVTAGQVLVIEAAGYGDFAEGAFFLNVMASGE